MIMMIIIMIITILPLIIIILTNVEMLCNRFLLTFLSRSGRISSMSSKLNTYLHRGNPINLIKYVILLCMYCNTAKICRLNKLHYFV